MFTKSTELRLNSRFNAMPALTAAGSQQAETKKGQDPVDMEGPAEETQLGHFHPGVEKMLAPLHQLGQWALAQAAAKGLGINPETLTQRQPPVRAAADVVGKEGPAHGTRALPPGRRSREGDRFMMTMDSLSILTRGLMALWLLLLLYVGFFILFRYVQRHRWWVRYIPLLILMVLEYTLFQMVILALMPSLRSTGL